MQVGGQGLDGGDERVADLLGGVTVGQVSKQDVAGRAFDERGDRRLAVSADDEVAFLTVQGVVEARRVLIALLGAAGMASDRPVVVASQRRCKRLGWGSFVGLMVGVGSDSAGGAIGWRAVR